MNGKLKERRCVLLAFPAQPSVQRGEIRAQKKKEAERAEGKRTKLV